MANTFTIATRDGAPIVVGNKRMVYGTLTMTDAGTSEAASGLDYIDHAQIGAVAGSITTAVCAIKFNTTTNGDLLAATCSSGDAFYVWAIGN